MFQAAEYLLDTLLGDSDPGDDVGLGDSVESSHDIPSLYWAEHAHSVGVVTVSELAQGAVVDSGVPWPHKLPPVRVLLRSRLQRTYCTMRLCGIGSGEF